MDTKELVRLVKVHEYFVQILVNKNYEDVPVEYRSEDAITKILFGITKDICDVCGLPFEDMGETLIFIEDLKEEILS